MNIVDKKIAIVGAGPAGICLMAALKRAKDRGENIPQIKSFEKQKDHGGSGIMTGVHLMEIMMNLCIPECTKILCLTPRKNVYISQIIPLKSILILTSPLFHQDQ